MTLKLDGTLLVEAHPGDFLVFHSDAPVTEPVAQELARLCEAAGVKSILISGDLTVAAVHRCEP